MMEAENSGFKGNVVHVSEATIQGTPAGFRVALRITFSDNDGIVHAITRHEMVDPLPGPVRDTASRFIEALVTWATSVHFKTSTPNTPKEKVIHGLAESLGNSTDPPEGFIPQG